MKKNEFSKNVDLKVLNSISEKYDYSLEFYLYNEEYTAVQICALIICDWGFCVDDELDLDFKLALANWFIRYKYYDEEDFSNEYNDEDYNWEEIYKDAEEIAYDFINAIFEEKENVAC